ncbi:MAG: hypothetical protein HOC91_10335 [Nitrospinaceae bacterium]|nr:hypothetical protein [Nitrospinaceae bacterium]MBT4430901.1 hypothetical protein [Nitrospinaceae bacterium]MBT5367722.1 hypothetical protein [Nitrospinaceae bacterium]MBT6395156.1 hypothetical protein [Nitrospinaceae bacterium]MBT7855285.1 hypothetical protein [Nitrospinaceae bacterium]
MMISERIYSSIICPITRGYHLLAHPAKRKHLPMGPLWFPEVKLCTFGEPKIISFQAFLIICLEKEKTMRLEGKAAIVTGGGGLGWTKGKLNFLNERVVVK